MANCLKCQAETSNPKFCSRSCAATFNNVLHPKRKLEGKCARCGINITRRNIYCKECRKLTDMTLREAIYSQHHKSSAFALVRWRARKVIADLGIDKCQVCGYSKHIETAHIKPISEFDLDVLLSEINNPKNLAALCPNCHWELDHKK